eukprot:257956_1
MNLQRRKGTNVQSRWKIFGSRSTACLVIFFMLYVIGMICFLPTLNDEQKATKIRTAADNIRRKEKAFVGHVKDETHAWKEDIKKLRRGVRDEIEIDLMDKAHSEYIKNHRPFKKSHAGKIGAKHSSRIVVMDKAQSEHNKSIMNKNKKAPLKPNKVIDRVPVSKIEDTVKKDTTGFIVLGMHRSGTSMLSGLLVEGFGYKTGGPVIQPAYDNEKGFFELIPAVLQNDEFMYEQHINWAGGVGNYDAARAIRALKAKKINFEKGRRALKVLNNPNLVPWLQKDPRMCITLRTWLPLLDSKPAVIFTYRNPLEVAMSLAKREGGFTLMRGLKLWLAYNKAAVQNSSDLCVVRSSNNDVLKDPLNVTKKISKELTTKCGVPAPPSEITQEIVDGFVDPTLQHNKRKLEKKNAGKKVLKTFNGNCDVFEFKSKLPGIRQEKEKEIYLKAMKVYCDFESGDAYSDDYEWPEF